MAEQSESKLLTVVFNTDNWDSYVWDFTVYRDDVITFVKYDAIKELRRLENKLSLLPCPFCGFTPSMEDDDCVYPINQERDVWVLNCYETGGGCGASVLGSSVLSCVERWNQRIKCRD